MGKFWLLWMSAPNAAIEYDQWGPFRDEIAAALVIMGAGAIVVTLNRYQTAALAMKIRQPADLFGPFLPLWWLLLAIAPGVAMFARYGWRFDRAFPDNSRFWVGGACQVGLYAVVLTLIISYIIICTTRITPAKFRYRPRPFWGR